MITTTINKKTTPEPQHIRSITGTNAKIRSRRPVPVPLFLYLNLLLFILCITTNSCVMAKEEGRSEEIEGDEMEHLPQDEGHKENKNNPSVMEEIENNLSLVAASIKKRIKETLGDQDGIDDDDYDYDDDYDDWEKDERDDNAENEKEFGEAEDYNEEDKIEDDRTWLDVFGEMAKEILTQHVIPPTNAECRWDWISARCEPYCNCAFIPQLGDYHLGRSCRFRDKNTEGIENLPDWEEMDVCHVPPNTKYARTVRGILRTKKEVGEIVQIKARDLSTKADVKGKVIKARGNMCSALLPDVGDEDFYQTTKEGDGGETKRKKLHRLLCDQDKWVKMKVESEMLENDFFASGGIGRRYLS
mmetsp:Transcript_12596/g.18388  ORF Transcript_12596/g.18388 Transcript_12596/m.18388 type:complete len:359 (+) Transcript_12596:171-1247(+)